MSKPRFFSAWYQPDCHMTWEEWQYIGILLGVSILAFDVGLLIGWILTLLL